ncbi:MAG: ATP-dependent helicase [Gaiellaceae bacterium]
MDSSTVFSGLNDGQRRAVEAVRGPVCILAGAGSGKTTTITRRVAHQVASGAFAASEILAVTFTDKAATEMRARLAALGADGVAARTFHAAALGQLHAYGGGPPGKIVASKALALRQIANTLPRPYRFRPAGDLATEVEWAKNRRLTPATYLDGLDGHEPPIPADLMVRVFKRYEERKAEAAYVDFEDLLERAIALFDDAGVARAVRERFRAFTVDEYQDVNLLQQTLLDRWRGDSEELCAVGDDYQSIYAFTAATPAYLLALRTRFDGVTVVRLEDNYRSTPEVLALANRLVPKLGGAEKTLRATRPSGPQPTLQAFASHGDEAAFVVRRIRELAAEGVALEGIAVLCRTNARLADFEEVFHDARIPFQGAALLGREAARRLLRRIRELNATAVGAAVRGAAEDAGWLEHPPDKLGEREQVRQADLSRFVRLAREFDDGTRTTRDFVDDLERRFGSKGAERRGVHLLTLHGAKGLEFDAVFLPRVEERELPIRAAKRDEEIAEERRLLYVGLTRAHRHLALTWSGRPSRFLRELGVDAQVERTRTAREEPDDPLYAALKRWRLDRATADEKPAYVVFHNSTLAEIAARRPRDLAELGTVPGVGPAKLARYGSDLLAVLSAA